MTTERVILTGDSREVLRTLEPESFAAIVCDPPYELGFMSARGIPPASRSSPTSGARPSAS